MQKLTNTKFDTPLGGRYVSLKADMSALAKPSSVRNDDFTAPPTVGEWYSGRCEPGANPDMVWLRYEDSAASSRSRLPPKELSRSLARCGDFPGEVLVLF